MENLNIREIVATDLLDYSLKLEEALKEGYSVSVSNDFAPRAIGYAMYAWVVKDTSKNTPTKPVETISEVSEGVGSQKETEAIVEGMRSVPDKVDASTQVVEDKPKVTKRGRK